MLVDGPGRGESADLEATPIEVVRASLAIAESLRAARDRR
jgi:hypothetical protein